MDVPSFTHIPWSATRDEFEKRAAEAGAEAECACCVFVVADDIPERARPGYAALVIAYARANEPVTILEDGAAALLITEGGADSGRIAAERVIAQMKRLALDQTLRAGIAPVSGGGVAAALAAARSTAEAAAPGEVALQA